MKIFIVALLVLISTISNAQSFWSHAIDPFNKSHNTDMVLFQDSLILVGGIVNEAQCPYHKLFVYNLSGRPVWSKKGYYDLITVDSTYIYTVGFTITDDVGGYEQVIISKYDKYGNEVFTIQFPKEVPNGLNFRFICRNIEIVEDGTLLISSPHAIIKTDTMGDKFRLYNVILESEINSVHSISPTTYLINTQDKIYKTDSSFALRDSILFPKSINKIDIKDDTIYTVTASYLIRLDTNLNIIDTLLTNTQTISNLEIYQNNIWVYSINQDSIKMIILSDPTPNNIRVFPLLANNIQSVISHNNFIFSGTSFTNQIGVYSFQTDSNRVPEFLLPDIEIVDFEVDSVILNYNNGNPVPGSFSFIPKIIIKNNGLDTLNSFSVYARLFGGFNCGKNFFYATISNRDILPGQLDTIYCRRVAQWTINNFELCIQVMAPNAKLETLIDNNYVCKYYEPLKSKNSIATEMTLYPNPFSNFLEVVQNGSEIKNVKIFDLNGSVVISKRFSNPYFKIETESLAPGVYIVQIKSGAGVNSSRVIKQ